MRGLLAALTGADAATPMPTTPMPAAAPAEEPTTPTPDRRPASDRWGAGGTLTGCVLGDIRNSALFKKRAKRRLAAAANA